MSSPPNIRLQDLVEKPEGVAILPYCQHSEYGLLTGILRMPAGYITLRFASPATGLKERQAFDRALEEALGPLWKGVHKLDHSDLYGDPPMIGAPFDGCHLGLEVSEASLEGELRFRQDDVRHLPQTTSSSGEFAEGPPCLKLVEGMLPAGELGEVLKPNLAFVEAELVHRRGDLVAQVALGRLLRFQLHQSGE